MEPTKEQIRAALLIADTCTMATPRAAETFEAIRQLAAAYRATQRPAQIVGRVIGYVISAALGVLALAGLLAAVKVLVGAVG